MKHRSLQRYQSGNTPHRCSMVGWHIRRRPSNPLRPTLIRRRTHRLRSCHGRRTRHHRTVQGERTRRQRSERCPHSAPVPATGSGRDCSRKTDQRSRRRTRSYHLRTPRRSSTHRHRSLRRPVPMLAETEMPQPPPAAAATASLRCRSPRTLEPDRRDSHVAPGAATCTRPACG